MTVPKRPKNLLRAKHYPLFAAFTPGEQKMQQELSRLRNKVRRLQVSNLRYKNVVRELRLDVHELKLQVATGRRKLTSTPSPDFRMEPWARPTQ